MKRKGITPVIAVVLLLLITVGAVGGAWTTYQELIANQDTSAFDARQQASNTDFEFASVYATQNGAINMTIKNTGQRAANLSDEVSFYIIPPGSDGRLGYTTFVARSPNWDHPNPNTCFDSNAGILETGETYSCGTGLEFPNATQELGLVIDYDDVSSTSWEYNCNPQTSSTITC